MVRVGLLVVCVLLLCAEHAVCRNIPDGRVELLELSRVTREVDLTTTLVKEKVTLVVENIGSKTVSYVLYTLEPQVEAKVAFINAKIQGNQDDGIPTYVVKDRPLPQQKDAGVYRISIPSLAGGGAVTVEVEVVMSNAIVPFPHQINQNDRQLVKFVGNSYIYSPYLSSTQSTTFTLPSDKIESFSRVSPTNSDEQKLTYGPYSGVPAFSQSKVEIHFENNGPFLKVAELERIIEVSHWGNIVVEEHVHMQHIGAVLKGSFSRYDFQRNPNSGPSAVKDFTTLLPAAARDIYYRDEIGNISTSNAREEEDFVSLELRPRFPLFGGWQTRYYYGYNLPSYEYLFHRSSQYLLKMRLMDHIVDDQLVGKLTVKIILPEGAKNIDFRPPPYEVTEGAQEVKLTYLDTLGRPVIVCHADNLVEQHVQDFELSYTFESFMLLQEPLLIVTALFIFFLCVIVIVRLDFSITEDVALVARQQASVQIEAIQQAHDIRAALIPSYISCIASFKNSRDVKTFKTTKKSLDGKFKVQTEKVSSLLKELQGSDPESSSKLTDVQKKMSEVKTLLEESCFLAEKVVSGNVSKQNYVDQNKITDGKIEKIMQEVDSILHTL